MGFRNGGLEIEKWELSNWVHNMGLEVGQLKWGPNSSFVNGLEVSGLEKLRIFL